MMTIPRTRVYRNGIIVKRLLLRTMYPWGWFLNWRFQRKLSLLLCGQLSSQSLVVEDLLLWIWGGRGRQWRCGNWGCCLGL